MRDYLTMSTKSLNGRDRRLLAEWKMLAEQFDNDPKVEIEITRRNSTGLPTQYQVTYHITTMCGTEGDDNNTAESEPYDLRGSIMESSTPRFANRFVMMLTLPPSYPCIDGAPQLQFVEHACGGEEVAMPWHPNIRYYGSFKGRVCLNAMDSFVELRWCVERVAKYLRYEIYHSIQEPPFPEDLRVARWLNHNIDNIPWEKIE